MLRIFVVCLSLFWSLAAFSQAQPLTLSLREAILLAMRENPNVQQAQLNHVMQKFALRVAHWQFEPHYALTGSYNTTRTVAGGMRNTSKNWTIQPGVSLNTPIGTQINVTALSNETGHYNPALSVQVIQPLIRGFGKAVVEASLYNAIDSEYGSRLSVEGAMRNTITSVINAYLDVVSAESTVIIDKKALKRAQISVQQTKLFIKAGRKAGVELVTVQADVANAQSTLENDKNNLEQTRYALLAAIGVDPNTKITFTNIDVPDLIKKYAVPTLEETKYLTLKNDIQYQIDQITINGATRRSLLVAEDNARWQLNLTLNGTAGGGSGGGENAGINSLFNGANNTESAMLNLTIPIDDKNAEQAIVNARIGLRQARLALKVEKWNKETGAINGWNTIYSSKRALKFAERAELLQDKTYKIGFQKYSYGLIDSIELQTLQQQLIKLQQALLSAQIAYLKSLVNLDQQIGRTLQTWDVQVRYS